MKTVNFTEFRRQASELISEVERGETLVVIRHGKPIAEVSPFVGELAELPSWRRPGLRLATRGSALSKAILEEREAER
jgi:prevent-host-death family protein